VKDREEKLDIMSKLDRGEQIVDVWCNVRLAYNSVLTIHGNADRIKECAKSGTKVFV
jgi:hypothetical protein